MTSVRDWRLKQKISEYNLMRNNSQRQSLALSATYILGCRGLTESAKTKSQQKVISEVDIL